VKVMLCQSDRGGCRFYRLAEPARVARERHDVLAQVVADFPLLPGPFERGLHVPQNLDVDVVVFQRPAKAKTLEAIAGYQKLGKAVVVDVDDDYSCLHPQNPARNEFNPTLSPNTNWRNVARACAMADLVTVTTPALAERYAGHGRVAVLPNCVPASLLELPSTSNGRTLGWTGAASNHPGDLEVTRGGVEQALQRTGWDFKVIGPREGVARALSLTGTMPGTADATGPLEMHEWHDHLGLLDVGIVPLCATDFNRAKSTLKGLEYAGAGIPFVASTLPEYERLAAEGVGTLAPDRARSWRAALAQIMDDESLRHELAERGRTAIAERHTYEGEGWRWTEAWERAVQNSNSTRRAVA
jgi:glycosyltransferase involved in cell wall biosynthesis